MTYEFAIKKTVLNDNETVRVMDVQAAISYLRREVYDASEMWREKCFALFLSGNNNIIGHMLVGVGGLESVIIDNRIVAKGALDTFASGVILTHNHPSGNARPGFADIKQTESLKKALDLFDIKLTDHVILTEKTAYSFSEEKTFDC